MIFVIHGFLSSSNNTKVNLIRKIFPNEKIVAPDLPPSSVRSWEILCRSYVEEIKKGQTKKTMVVGSSLGGFYAYCMAAVYEIPCFLINPSMTPHITLLPRVWNTEKFDFSDLTKLGELGQRYFQEAPGLLVNVFVCNDDKTLPHEIITRNYFMFCSNRYVEFEQGGHRFSKVERLIPYLKDVYESIRNL